MKFKYASDLHLEFFNVPGTREEAIQMICEAGDEDIVLLFAGDLDYADKVEAALRAFSQAYRAVIYVPGNHEYYNFAICEAKNIFTAIDIPNVHVLNPGSIEIDDVKIVGGTLWTNLLAEQPVDVMLCQKNISDFSVITGMSPQTFTRMHLEDREAIIEALTDADDRNLKSLVLTHHFPSYKCIHPRFEASPLNPAFAARLDDVIHEFAPNYWIFGHTHDTVRVTIGETALMSNPFGYIMTDHNPRFTMDYYMEI